MANIKITLDYPIYDGVVVTFNAPCDCTAADGLTVAHPDGSQTFSFCDAHGTNLSGIGDVFAEGVPVRVILDVTTSRAFIQNGDNNSHIVQLKNDIDASLEDLNRQLASLGTSEPPLEFITKYTTAGSYTWTCPEDGNYVVVIVGAGGGGGVCSKTNSDVIPSTMASGGSCGDYTIYQKSFIAQESANLVVGAGSTISVNYTSLSYKMADCGVGGTTSFDGITVAGGAGGKVALNNDTNAASFVFPEHGDPMEREYLFYDDTNRPPYNPVVGGSVVCNASNASGGWKATDRYPKVANSKAMPVWFEAPPAKFGNLGTVTSPIYGNDATVCGGGGAATMISTSSAGTTYSGKGGDGGVFIYKVKEEETA